MSLKQDLGISGSNIAGIALAAIGALYALAGYENVELNESGIKVVMLGEGSGTTHEMTPGMQWIEPIANDVFIYDTRSEQYSIEGVGSETNDGQPVVADVSFEIRLLGSKIGELHKTIGRDWYEEVVYPAARKFIRMNTSAVSSDEIYTGKGKRLVSNGIQKDLDYLKERGIAITVNLRRVQFTNADFIQSLEDKAIAAQKEEINRREAAAAEQEAIRIANVAEGQKQKTIKEAEANAEQSKLEGIGLRDKNIEEAKGILAIGRAKAESTRLMVNAYGAGSTYASVKWAESIGDKFQVFGVPTGAPGTTSFMDMNGMLKGAFSVNK